MKHAAELHRQAVPRRLLILDAVGAALLAVGVLELLETGPQLLPGPLRSAPVAITLVVVGVLLMLALPAWLLQRHRRGHPHGGKGSRP